jgi:hypothetical protein
MGVTGRRGWMAMAVLATALGTSACGPSRDEAETRLAELEADDQAMDAAFDEVEERLLGNQSKVHMWAELQRRHGHVSALHIASTDEHLNAMLKHVDKFQNKSKELQAARRRGVAVGGPADAVLTSGTSGKKKK